MTDRLERIAAKQDHVLMLLEGLVLEDLDFDEETKAAIKLSAQSVINRASKKIAEHLGNPEWKHSSLDTEMSYSHTLSKQRKYREAIEFLEECIGLMGPQVVPWHFFEIQQNHWMLMQYDEAIEVMNRLMTLVSSGSELIGPHTRESLENIILDVIDRSRTMKNRPPSFEDDFFDQTIDEIMSPLDE